MADEKVKMTPEQFDALERRLAVAEAKLAAQEEAAAEQPQPFGGEAVSSKAPKKPVLSGDTFKVGGATYKVKYPVIHHKGKNITESDILEDKKLQEELVKNHPGVLVKLAALLLLLFALAAPVQASTVTINPYGAEVVTTTSREFYPLQDLLIITRPSTDAFEIQTAATRGKIWGGDIDSVTISGASTDGDKWAFLCTVMLEATTTNGYICWLGRNDLVFSYKASNSRMTVKWGSNQQPLWFGHIDSLKANRTSVTLAYTRLLNRYRANDFLPSTSAATIAAGAAAGTSPTVTATGDAYSGSISVTTGTSATTGTLATVTLKITAATGTRVVLTPTGNNSTLHVARWRASGTTTTLVITVPTTALSDATAYTWDYHTVPY